MTTAEQLSKQIVAAATTAAAKAFAPLHRELRWQERRLDWRDKHTIPRGQEAEYERRQQAADRLAQARERDGD